jgi:hypothetical protein
MPQPPRVPRAAGLAAPALVFTALALATPSHAASFTYTTLDAPGYEITSMAALNDSDQTAGFVQGKKGVRSGIIWSAGSFTGVPQTQGFIAIDNAGVAAGQNALHPFNSKTFIIYNLATGNTASNPIRNEGLVYLLNGNSAGQLVARTQHKYNLPSSTVMVTGSLSKIVNYPGANDTFPGGIGPSGLVAGVYLTATSDCLFTYQAGTYKSYPTTLGTVGAGQNLAVAADDTIGGSLSTASTSSAGFLLKKGIYTEVFYPGSVTTAITAIGPDGEAVGNWTDSAGLTHGMIYRHGKYDSIDYPGAIKGTYLEGVNAKGTLLGTYVGASTDLHPFIAQCAEPVACTK